MNMHACRSAWVACLAVVTLLLSACGGGSGGVVGSGGAVSGNGGASSGGAGGSASAGVSVSLSESAFTFETPDQKHALTATVTGGANTQVTWSTSNSYIATVDPTGMVTSVSGGEVTITATSSADSSKSASASIAVAEPKRARATSYVDAKSVVSGPVNILMCGDSLMRTYPATSTDQAGWGQVLKQFFGDAVTVDNTIANGGRSSRSFYNEFGRWNVIKTRLMAAQASKTPTFVFIMFGHNDQKKVTDTQGADYLTFASANPNGSVAGTYYDYLERYVVEARELGGIPVLLTPFVREYLEGTPARVSVTGQHDIVTPYPGEATARGDYPAAVKAVAEKHDVPVVDITSWSKAMVEARAAADTLDYVYIQSDQTHIRNLGALLIAEEVVRALNEQGILTAYAKPRAPSLMLDSGTLAFGGLYAGSTLERSFRITPFGDVTGDITITAPLGYQVSLDGVSFTDSASVACDANYTGSVVNVRFSPVEAISYNSALSVLHSSLTPDYGNTLPNLTPGAITLTGNGKVALSGTPATATWVMASGTTIVTEAVLSGAISANPAKLVGLVNKSVASNAARFDVPGGAWPAESARNEARYVEFSVAPGASTFTLDSISLDGGTGGGSNIRWDIVYSLTPDFQAPTVLAAALSAVKDTLATSTFPSLGVEVPAGTTLYLRAYPYSTAAAASGKSFMIANVIVSGVTN